MGFDALAFGVDEVAEALGVSRELVRTMTRTADIPSVNAGRRWLISRNALVPERCLSGGDAA
jgi:excisionase family DNA binding protein